MCVCGFRCGVASCRQSVILSDSTNPGSRSWVDPVRVPPCGICGWCHDGAQGLESLFQSYFFVRLQFASCWLCAISCDKHSCDPVLHPEGFPDVVERSPRQIHARNQEERVVFRVFENLRFLHPFMLCGPLRRRRVWAGRAKAVCLRSTSAERGWLQGQARGQLVGGEQREQGNCTAYVTAVHAQTSRLRQMLCIIPVVVCFPPPTTIVFLWFALAGRVFKARSMTVADIRLRPYLPTTTPSTFVVIENKTRRRRQQLQRKHFPQTLDDLQAFRSRNPKKTVYAFCPIVGDGAASSSAGRRGAQPPPSSSSSPSSSPTLPRRLWQSLALASGVAEGQTWAEVSKAKLSALAQQLTACDLQVLCVSVLSMLSMFVCARGWSCIHV